MAPMSLPAWLSTTWTRSYIRRAVDGGALGPPDSSVAVRYLQTQCGGHAFDLRIPEGLAASLAGVGGLSDLSLAQLQSLIARVEAFAGVAIAEPVNDEWLVRWHAAFLFPPQLTDDAEPQAVLERILAGAHHTDDVGRAVPDVPRVRSQSVTRWLEHAPDGSYEEEWLMLESFSARGAHVAAMRPARPGVAGMCWLAILGNTFAFVRDLDRSAIPPQAKNRALAEVLADDAFPLAAKRQMADCEFSFGFFGQNGGVGGVVERSSLPWRVGTALATLVGEAQGWEALRVADAPVLEQALAAIVADHQKACAALREAVASGQDGAADVLRARGAVS